LAAATGAPITVVEDDRKLPKTKLTRKELREFEALLLTKRHELVGSVGNLTDEALGRNRRDASGDLSSMPIHMADLGSDNWEQEFTLGLIDSERKLLREIDEALARIKEGTYGICLATHRPILKERLRAKPWAKYCIEYVRLQEAGRVP
jgi:RNA polymerase-binding protein DksA